MSAVFGDKAEEIIQVSSGAYHTLVLTSKSEVFGIGKSNVGQLCQVTEGIVKMNKIEI